MKTIITIFFLALISCSDDPEPTYCYECVTTVKTTGGGMSDIGTSVTSRCEITASEAKQMEEAGTYTTSATSGGVTFTMTAKTICGRK